MDFAELLVVLGGCIQHPLHTKQIFFYRRMVLLFFHWISHLLDNNTGLSDAVGIVDWCDGMIDDHFDDIVDHFDGIIDNFDSIVDHFDSIIHLDSVDSNHFCCRGDHFCCS